MLTLDDLLGNAPTLGDLLATDPIDDESIEKYNAWHTQQPRDKFGRWTKGFVTGAFSPIGKEQNAPVVSGPMGPGKKPKAGKEGPDGKMEPNKVAAPFVGLAGTESGFGGAKHGLAGWQTQPSWKGQPAGSKAMHAQALASYTAHMKDLATPNDVASQIQTGAEKVGRANDFGQIGAQDGTGAVPETQDPAATGAGMAAMQAAFMAGTADPEDLAATMGSGGIDPEAFDENNLPPSLQGGYPEPGPGESIIPPPGLPMPHEVAAEAAAEADHAKAVTWPDVDATPFNHAKTGGTNEGGFFSINGVKGYAKFYDNPDQAQSEKLANDLYNAVGVKAPKSHLVSIDGRKAIFNELIDGSHMTPAAVQAHPQMHSGFAMDAILANHDVVGLTHDNIMQDAGGQAYRMDNGGALKYRAQGALKPANALTAEVGQLDSMRDTSRTAGKTFQHVSNEDLGHQIAAIAATLTPETVDNFVAGAGYKGEEAAAYSKLINDRIAGTQAWAQQNAPQTVQPSLAPAAPPEPEPSPLDTPAAPTATGNPAVDSIHPSLTADAVAGIWQGKKPTFDMTPGTMKAAANQDAAAFIASITKDPELFKKAARKAWTGEQGKWAAQQVAGVLAHLTGKAHPIEQTPMGNWRVSSQKTPIIAQPEAKAEMPPQAPPGVTAQANPGPKEWHKYGHVLDDWKTQGASAQAVLDLPNDGLQAFAHGKYANGMRAKAVAGLLTHKFGDVGGSFHATFDEATGTYGVEPGKHTPAHEYEKFGLPHPDKDLATHEHLPHPLVPVDSQQGQPGKAQDTIANLNAEGHHALADWYKAHAESKGMLGEQHIKPGDENAFLKDSLNYKDVPFTSKDSQHASSLLAGVDEFNGNSVASLKGKLDGASPHLLAALHNLKHLNMDQAVTLKFALKQIGVGNVARLTDDGEHHYVTSSGVLPHHVEQIKTDTPGSHHDPAVDANASLFHDPNFTSADFPDNFDDHNDATSKHDTGALNNHQGVAAAQNLEADTKSLAGLVNGSFSHAHASSFAHLLNAKGSKFDATVVSDDGGASYKLHLAAREKHAAPAKPVSLFHDPNHAQSNATAASTVAGYLDAKDSKADGVKFLSGEPGYLAALVNDPLPADKATEVAQHFNAHSKLHTVTLDHKGDGTATLHFADKNTKTATAGGLFHDPNHSPSLTTPDDIAEHVSSEPSKKSAIQYISGDDEHMAALANVPLDGAKAAALAESFNQYSSKYNAGLNHNADGTATLNFSHKNDGPPTSTGGADAPGLFHDANHVPSSIKPETIADHVDGKGHASATKDAVDYITGEAHHMATLANVPMDAGKAAKLAQHINQHSADYDAAVNAKPDGTATLKFSKKGEGASGIAQPSAQDIESAEGLHVDPNYLGSGDELYHGYAKDAFVTKTNKATKPGGYDATYYGKQVGKYVDGAAGYGHTDDQYAKHVANTAWPPAQAKKIANVINAHSKKYDAHLVATKTKNKSTGKTTTTHTIKLLPKSGASIAPITGSVKAGATKTVDPNAPKAVKTDTYDAQHAQAQNPSGVLTSEHSTAIKLAQKTALPKGVSGHDVALSGEAKQQERIAALRAGGNHNGADFLEAHYAKVNAQAQHPHAAGQVLHIMGTKHAPSPFKTPQQITDQVVNGGHVFPEGVSHASLEATTPGDRAAALERTNYGTSRDWLKEFYKHRDEANASVGLSGQQHTLTTSTKHAGFSNPDVYKNRADYTPKTAASNVNGLDTSHYSGDKSMHTFAGSAKKQHVSAHARTPAQTGTMGGHSLSHLDVTGQHSLATITAAAREKCKSLYAQMADAHTEKMASGYQPPDPFGSLPPEGAHPQSEHAYKLTQTHFEPLLATARACTPAHDVMRTIQNSQQSRNAMRKLAAGMFDEMTSHMAVDSDAMYALRGEISAWLGSGQSDGAMSLRVGSNMLRGLRPGQNTIPGASAQHEQNATTSYAAAKSPDYFKALLASKAVTQAIMERYADANGTLPMVRGIRDGPAKQMMGKTAADALASAQEGRVVQSKEMTMSGYSLDRKEARKFGSTFLHRNVEPEALWQAQMASPLHNGFEAEQENFVAHDGGGPMFTLVHSVPSADAPGNFCTASTASTPKIEAHYDGLNHFYQAATTSFTKGLDSGLPPTTRDGWYTPVPPDWKPSQEQIDAFVPMFTDPDGVIRLETDRDEGWMDQYARKTPPASPFPSRTRAA